MTWEQDEYYRRQQREENLNNIGPFGFLVIAVVFLLAIIIFFISM